MQRVAILCTLDTKCDEAVFLQECLRDRGVDAFLVDVGVMGLAKVPVAVERGTIARLGGVALADLQAAGDTGSAIAVMAKGAAAWARAAHQKGKLDGIVGLGGSKGSAIAGAAMQVLPLGVPKLLISPTAAGNTRRFVGTRDVTLMHSVTDIMGLNTILCQVLEQGAAAMAGMLHARPTAAVTGGRNLILTTAFGVTTPCVMRCKDLLETVGYEVLVFSASGAGGQCLEDLAVEVTDRIALVLDITTTELADELCGGICSAGPRRLEAAGRAGLPQVVVPGALDVVNFGPAESVPGRYRRRRIYRHSPVTTLVRTNRSENERLGTIMAAKLAAARGPAAVLVPLEGFSAYDRKGGVFWNPAADSAWLAALRAGLPPAVTVREFPYHINDPRFADELVAMALELLATTWPASSVTKGARSL